MSLLDFDSYLLVVQVLLKLFFASQVLNGLEVMGYKVVSCGDYMTGEQRHDQKEFVWTMYKNKEEWESSSK